MEYVASDALGVLAGTPPPRPNTGPLIKLADSAADYAAYRELRRRAFVLEYELFDRDDRDDIDDDARTLVLVAVVEGRVVGGVRLAPAHSPDIGWWTGSRLVVAADVRHHTGIGKALVRAACAAAEQAGVLRFEATVRTVNAAMFTHLGWEQIGSTAVANQPHAWMRWPIGRVSDLVAETKAFLGQALAPFTGAPHGLGGAGFVGDDGAPVPTTDVIAACDAIVPSMVQRDPSWAGWCGALVNINDLAAMGADPLGLLDAVGAPTGSLARQVIRGLADAAQRWQVPVLGGHTQLGVPAALSVTALGRTSAPIPAAGGRVGDTVRLSADLAGQWRPGYTGRQWDSTSTRTTAELRALTATVAAMAPAAAKDVSMAGMIGTVGMLAEASGTGAVVEMAAIPRPAQAAMGDWVSCFPGWAMITTDRPHDDRPPAPRTSPAVSQACGALTAAPGVRLRWPDSVETPAIGGGVTGLGAAHESTSSQMRESSQR